MLNTIAGERYDQDFGINYELFFTTGIPDAIADEARDVLERNGFTGEVTVISSSQGTITLEIAIKNGNDTETLNQTISTFN
ncbi:MAG: hypothetical protein F6K65_39000 [Moorea sp. SIO3C2]|nr:hypothetical protein [Moorena sp. SIO3C2]